MDIRDKIVRALRTLIEVDYVRLEDDDGISGFVVSPQFQDMSMLDRQSLIEQALTKSPNSLDPMEKRDVLMIAGLTPAEYETVGARIRIDRVKELAKGTLEIILHGSSSDAEYVRQALNYQTGVQTTEPKPVADAVGILMSFRVKGDGTTPMTKATAIRTLKSDRYIQVMPDPLDKESAGLKHSAPKKRSK